MTTQTPALGTYVRNTNNDSTGVVTNVRKCDACAIDDIDTYVVTLTSDAYPGAVIKYHGDSFEQLQRIWSHVSGLGHSGYIVTQVAEVIGDSINSSWFRPTQDGGHILIQSFHFFAKESVDKFLFEENSDYHDTCKHYLV